jgi:hypothetical protein
MQEDGATDGQVPLNTDGEVVNLQVSLFSQFKGIVSRKFVMLFLVPLDR